MKIPDSENALLIRTDFTDPVAWESLIAVLRDPPDPAFFNMEIVNDKSNSDATIEHLIEALPVDFPHSYFVVADSVAMADSEHPLLVVDVMDEPGRQFRALAAEVPLIDNNLSVSNMGFEEFASAVDDTGVFRGFPDA